MKIITSSAFPYRSLSLWTKPVNFGILMLAWRRS